MNDQNKQVTNNPEILDSINGYVFYARSNGVAVIKDEEYISFFETMEEALEHCFPENTKE